MYLKILKFLFRGYSKQLDNDVQTLKQELQESLELKENLYKQGLDVKDLVRERLRGLRPTHPDDNYLDSYVNGLEEPDRLVFLSKAHDIYENPAFKEVTKFLIVESEHKAVLHAEDMTKVNFARATINGLMLFEEEVERLSKMWKEESQQKQKMSEAERHSVI